MKLINFTGKLFACVTAFALASFMADAQAQNMQEGSATVRSIRGSAKYSLGGGVWVPLNKGKVLKQGAVIQTAPESIVDLYLGENGPVVRVTPNTTVGLEKLAYAGTGADTVIETRLDLKVGSILGNVKKLAKASKYEIKTPNGVAGIRGTDYTVTAKQLADGTYDVTFTCIDGTLVVAAMVDNQPKTVILNTGESWTVGNGEVYKTPAQLEEFLQAQIQDAIARAIVAASESPLHTATIEVRQSPTIGAGSSGSEGGFDEVSQ